MSARFARFVAAGTPSALSACLVSAAAVANGVPAVFVIPFAVLVAAVATLRLARYVPSAVIEAAFPTARPSWRTAGVCVLAAVALVETARLAAFMAHGPTPDAFAWTRSKFMRNHSCATSYYEGARNVGRVENVYDIELYRPKNDLTREVEGFRPDPYQYPPPFLLIAAPLARVVPSYVAFRGLWFAVIGAIVLAALWRLAAWIGGTTGGLLAWLSLAVWLTIPVQITLQIGNFQLAAIALAVLGMIAIRRGWVGVGAAIIGLVTVAKVFPGVLLLYLLLRKEYRAVAIGVVSAVACVAVSALAFGPRSLLLFATYQLPRLDTGEALPGLVMPGPIAINASIPGTVVKLQMFGVFLSHTYLSIAGWVYTAVVLVLTFRAAKRLVTREQEACVWLALLGLSAMRSPFLPPEYGFIPAIWIATIVLAAAKARTAVIVCVLSLVAFNLYLPGDSPVSPRLLAVPFAIGQAAAVLVCGWVLLRRVPAEARPQFEPV